MSLEFLDFVLALHKLYATTITTKRSYYLVKNTSVGVVSGGTLAGTGPGTWARSLLVLLSKRGLEQPCRVVRGNGRTAPPRQARFGSARHGIAYRGGRLAGIQQPVAYVSYRYSNRRHWFAATTDNLSMAASQQDESFLYKGGPVPCDGIGTG
jgi:hypothetical protein